MLTEGSLCNVPQILPPALSARKLPQLLKYPSGWCGLAVGQTLEDWFSGAHEAHIELLPCLHGASAVRTYVPAVARQRTFRRRSVGA